MFSQLVANRQADGTLVLLDDEFKKVCARKVGDHVKTIIFEMDPKDEPEIRRLLLDAVRPLEYPELDKSSETYKVLLPELHSFVHSHRLVGEYLSHPMLVLVPLADLAEANHWYKLKSANIQAALAKKDWYSATFFHEFPYRLDFFVSIAGDMPRREAARLVREVWVESENIYQQMPLWEKLFREYASEIRSEWSKMERKVLKRLPDPVTIFRGCCSNNREGFSWTLSEEKAQFFAGRCAYHGNESEVIKATVAKADILFFYDGRRESEIVTLEAVVS